MNDNMAAFAHIEWRHEWQHGCLCPYRRSFGCVLLLDQMFRKQCTVRQYTSLIYLINLLGKLVLGLWLDSELHYFSIFTEIKKERKMSTSTLSFANVTDVNLVLKERTHMRLCINMLIFTHNLGNWLIPAYAPDVTHDFHIFHFIFSTLHSTLTCPLIQHNRMQVD